MRIVCKKGTNVKGMLAQIRQTMEPDWTAYSVLKDDLILEVVLEDENGKECPRNGETIYIEKTDIIDEQEEYYDKDALTHLYNRGRYEKDIMHLQHAEPENFSCIYIDAVGLHEINNHLGHAAGDALLCTIAERIKECFPQGTSYRIGGDEFVIFCTGSAEEQLRSAILELKERLMAQEYEISVGMELHVQGRVLMDTINLAEHAMRCDKAQFYQKNGAKRQMRSLNHKLEKILLEKQDASQFLNVIAAEYKGVYMVNPDRDSCRYIYIPEYFRNILEENDGVFSKSIRSYCSQFVSEADQPLFYPLFDFETVLRELRQGKHVGFTYEKKDGARVMLQITIYDPNSADSKDMLWIFMDGSRQQGTIEGR